jgi:hypothetical protein
MEKSSLPSIKNPQVNGGLPQIYDDTAALLANLYLIGFDRIVSETWSADSYARWMDDLVFGVSTERGARKALAHLSMHARCLGLDLNPQKTKVIKSSSIYSEHLYIDVHRKFDEFELRLVLEESQNGDGGLLTDFSKLAGLVRNCVSRGSGELLLRRLYRLASVVGSSELVSRFDRDLISHPSCASAILQYLASTSWSSRITEGAARYLNHSANVYDTIEVQLMLSLLRRDVPVEARRELGTLAERILDETIPTSCDTSAGIAALLALRCLGKKAGSRVFGAAKAKFLRTPSAHAQRYLFAAMGCSAPSQTKQIMKSARVERHLHLRFLWDCMSRHDFSYDALTTKRAGDFESEAGAAAPNIHRERLI